MINTNHQGGFTKDRALTEIDGAYEPDMAGEIDTDADRLRQAAHPCKLDDAAVVRILAWSSAIVKVATEEADRMAWMRIATALWGKGDPKVRLAALAYVAGLECFQGKSMSEVALEIKCTKASLSKEANAWSDKLKMRSSAMKSEQSRDTYSQREQIGRAHV